MVITNINRCLFTGDTLSIGGCDPKFLGNENRMLIAIDEILKLPMDTKLMPGTESSKANLAFCKKVDPKNENISKF